MKASCSFVDWESHWWVSIDAFPGRGMPSPWERDEQEEEGRVTCCEVMRGRFLRMDFWIDKRNKTMLTWIKNRWENQDNVDLGERGIENEKQFPSPTYKSPTAASSLINLSCPYHMETPPQIERKMKMHFAEIPQIENQLYSPLEYKIVLFFFFLSLSLSLRKPLKLYCINCLKPSNH